MGRIPRLAPVWARIGAGGMLTCMLLLSSCNKPTQSAPPPAPPPSVDVVTLHARPVALTTELPGRLAPHRIADIRPQVSGVIQKRLFSEGDTVHQGQQLYQIDPKPYEAALASAKATLSHAKAAVVAAQMTVTRYRPLAQAMAISRQDLDTATAALGQDQADIESGNASVQTATINLAYTRMYAPISGRTGRSNVTEGALVTQNQTNALATITELDPIYVDVTEPSSLLLRLRREYAQGQLKKVGDDAAEVTLRLDDGSAYDHPGKLLFSEVTVDPTTGSVTLRALFPNPDGLLLPGMFVHETLQEGQQSNGLLVPQRGITHNTHGDPVAMVVGSDGKVAQRSLITDRAIGPDWLVTGGLAAGDQVVVSGLQSIRPGQEVHVRQVVVTGSTVQPVEGPAETSPTVPAASAAHTSPSASPPSPAPATGR